jgi:hypothetical protein
MWLVRLVHSMMFSNTFFAVTLDANKLSTGIVWKCNIYSRIRIIMVIILDIVQVFVCIMLDPET